MMFKYMKVGKPGRPIHKMTSVAVPVSLILFLLRDLTPHLCQWSFLKEISRMKISLSHMCLNIQEMNLKLVLQVYLRKMFIHIICQGL
uniref:Two-component response regulator-like APRR1 isoform X2 n=1 Tax=Rhizophora mucronata TaxID=61149 RepID=A0A2P2IU92_RHIMU